MKKALYICLGLLCITLGTIGIVMPLLPTTPFYLLGAFCFTKGSPRLHRWLTGTRLYQKHFESFAQTRSMTRRTKLAILLPVTAMLLVTFLLLDVPALRVLIAILLAAKYLYFIFGIKTANFS